MTTSSKKKDRSVSSFRKFAGSAPASQDRTFYLFREQDHIPGMAAGGELTEVQSQVPLAGDQHPVQALAAGAGNPSLRDRIRSWRPDRRLDDPDPGRREHGVERRGELGHRGRRGVDSAVATS